MLQGSMRSTVASSDLSFAGGGGGGEVGGEVFGEVRGEVHREDRSDEIPAVDKKHNGFTTKSANTYVTNDTSIDLVGARATSPNDLGRSPCRRSGNPAVQRSGVQVIQHPGVHVIPQS